MAAPGITSDHPASDGQWSPVRYELCRRQYQAAEPLLGSQLSDGSYNNNFVGSSDGVHAQFVDVDNCVFEFISLDTFSCDGYTPVQSSDLQTAISAISSARHNGGVEVFYCKEWIDTVWVENVTVLGGGLSFLQQNSLCRFAYYTTIQLSMTISTGCWV